MAVDAFNDNTINIFTDGSIYHNKKTGESIGSAGAILVVTKDNKRYEFRETVIDRWATNNTTEIKAISLGVDMAIRYAQTNGGNLRINLFSDSKTCILGLREWVFNWVNCVRNREMYSSSGKPVANQEIFKIIVDKILYYGIPIFLFHQKGHVKLGCIDSLYNARNCFNTSNGTNIQDMDFIKTISEYNDLVDLITKDELNILKSAGALDDPGIKQIVPVNMDISHSVQAYGNFINRRI